MSSKREFVIIYPRDPSLRLLPVWVSHWYTDYRVEFVESSYSDALRGMESVGDFGIDTEFYNFRVEKGEEYTSMIFLRTGEELFRFANDDLFAVA